MYQTNLITLQTAFFNCPQIGWRQATTEEIGNFQCSQEKMLKIKELKTALQNFLGKGLEYQQNNFRLTDDVLANLSWKKSLSDTNPARFTFCNSANKTVNFENETGFEQFQTAICDEQDRVMRKYNQYKEKINSCITAEEVKEIVINFND